MCNGFGAIVTENEIYFCEPDKDGDVSHSEILRRLRWRENANQFIRHFVRIECADWTMASFRFDEESTLPGWVDATAIVSRVAAVLSRAAQAWATYKAVRDPAWATYEAVCEQALATYKAVREQAWAQMLIEIAAITGYVPAKP